MTGQTTFVDGLVSVVMPVYNAEKYLAQALDSALCQTYRPIEIIAVDDCSCDASPSILEQYAQRHECVSFTRLENNQGAAVARNRALQIARGQYIAFLDSDDIWDAAKTKKQVRQMQEKGIAFSYTAYDMVDESGNLLKGKIEIQPLVRYRDLLTRTMISTPTVMIDRNRTGNVVIPLRRTGQDYAFWLYLLRQYDAYGIDEALVHVRRRPNSLSKNKFQNVRDVYETQVRFEHIPRPLAMLHTARYCLYALQKRFR